MCENVFTIYIFSFDIYSHFYCTWIFLILNFFCSVHFYFAQYCICARLSFEHCMLCIIPVYVEPTMFVTMFNVVLRIDNVLLMELGIVPYYYSNVLF